MRLTGWEQRLAELATARRVEPFSWGHNDCCLFAADAVQAITGLDPAADLRGYQGMREALRVVREAGGLDAILDQRFSRLPTARLAQRGDVVLVTDDAAQTLMAVVLGSAAVAPGERGLLNFPMSRWSAAWRVA